MKACSEIKELEIEGKSLIGVQNKQTLVSGGALSKLRSAKKGKKVFKKDLLGTGTCLVQFQKQRQVSIKLIKENER